MAIVPLVFVTVICEVGKHSRGSHGDLSLQFVSCQSVFPELSHSQMSMPASGIPNVPMSWFSFLNHTLYVVAFYPLSNRNKNCCFNTQIPRSSHNSDLLHLIITAFSYRSVEIGNSPRAWTCHPFVQLTSWQTLVPSTWVPDMMHTCFRSVSCAGDISAKSCQPGRHIYIL